MSSPTTAALLLATLSWTDEPGPTPPLDHADAARESMEWQRLSAEAARAEEFAYPMPMRREHTHDGVTHTIEPRQGIPPREANRILEIHGLMGAIGEQFGLAWTAEQDVQRLLSTRDGRDEVTQRVLVRAHCELGAHFLLGTAHSLANLVLRCVLLNRGAAESVTARRKYKRKGLLQPGTDTRGAWPTFNEDLVSVLTDAGLASANPALEQLTCVTADLYRSQEFRDLDGRRGMDYHRRRPQSVPHRAPREGTVNQTTSMTVLKMVTPQLEPDADATAVHRVVVASLDSTASVLATTRLLIAETIRNEGINYIF